MIFNDIAIKDNSIEAELETVLTHLGEGRVEGVAYDTAWIARLAYCYPNHGFEQSIEWLRQNQYEDGSWGAPVIHYHDRFISTLAAIVALKELGDERDNKSIKQGERILWHLMGMLGKDNNDTIGFPVVSAALIEEANHLGLDVPRAPVRFAAGYKRKVTALFTQEKRDWRSNSVNFSLEALRSAVHQDDDVFEANNAVNMSPSATAGYLLNYRHEGALTYLQHVLEKVGDGSVPAVDPIDIFETTWSLNHLRLASAIHPDDRIIRASLEFLWREWSQENGVSCSTFFTLPNLDDVASGFAVLRWGGYDVDPQVFAKYERDDHFYCFPYETDPSLGAHVRLLSALKVSNPFPQREAWIQKVVNVLAQADHNGAFWWDKWHVSPYYLTSSAIVALEGLANDLARTRIQWIQKTQHRDYGWGYMGESTPEETAYCLQALLYWNRVVEPVNPVILDHAAQYLADHISDKSFTPLWIGKSLYAPYFPIKSAILGAMSMYQQLRNE
jgi:hypothetical protein